MVECEDDAMARAEQSVAKMGERTRSCWAMARGCEPALGAVQVRATHALPMRNAEDVTFHEASLSVSVMVKCR